MKLSRTVLTWALAGGAAVAVAEDRLIWTLRSSEGPPARSAHAMAYDRARGVTVLFGGENGQTTLSDTWEWDGIAWTFRTEGTPPRRFRHGMAYDEAGAQIVVYGGAEQDRVVDFDERTWLWDGLTWVSVEQDPLRGRYRHAMAYDASRQQTVLFGGNTFGEDGGMDDGTYLWNGARWTLATSGFPSGRLYPAMAYDRQREVTVMFGGYRTGGGTDDTFEWDGAAWAQVADGGPLGRYGQGMAFDALRGLTVLFGGQLRDGSLGDDTWEWDGGSWQPADAVGPSARTFTAMAYDAERQVTVLFGGETEQGLSGETWEYGPDCNGNGELDWLDIHSGASRDRDGDQIPDECEPCEHVTRLKATCKPRDGRFKIRAALVAQLPEDTPFTFTLDGEEPHAVTLNERGRAKTSWVSLVQGPHEVCFAECLKQDLCRQVACP